MDVSIISSLDVTATFDGTNIDVTVDIQDNLTVSVDISFGLSQSQVDARILAKIDSELSSTSENAVQNKIINAEFLKHKGYFIELTDCACPITIDSLTYELTGDDEATITCVASQGLGTLTYTLSQGGEGIAENETGVFVVTEEDTFTVTVSDEIGSTEASDTVNVQFYDDDIIVYKNRLTTPLSATAIAVINSNIVGLKTDLGDDNLTDSFDQILLFSNETAESTLKNIVKSSNDGQAVNSPTFTQYESWQGNGSTSYINENYIPNTNGVKFTKDNASFGYISLSNIQGLQYDVGCRDSATGPHTWIAPNVENTEARCHINDSQSAASKLTVLTLSTEACYIASRTTANLCALYREGVLFSTVNYESSALPSVTTFALGVNSEGSYLSGAGSTKKLALTFKGRGFSPSEIVIVNYWFKKLVTEMRALA